MFLRWRLHSLYPRLLLAMIATIVVVLVSITALEVRYSQERLSSDLPIYGETLAKFTGISSRQALENHNIRSLIDLAREAAASEQVEYAAFFDQDGNILADAAAAGVPAAARVPFTEILAQFKADNLNTVRWTDQYLEIIKPVNTGSLGQSRLGMIALRINTQYLREARSQVLARGIFTGLILATVLSVAVGLLLRQLVMVPLRRLGHATEMITAGTWTTLQGTARNDEFGQVSRSFSQMVQTLQAREAQLQEQIGMVQRLNAELDARVAARTVELNDLVERQAQLLGQIREMSTPVVPLINGVVVIPIVGNLDSQRASQLIQSTLAGIESHQARLTILDITGVPVVDTHVARAIAEAPSLRLA
jgi:methyl-accepting chemotaxis protein